MRRSFVIEREICGKLTRPMRCLVVSLIVLSAAAQAFAQQPAPPKPERMPLLVFDARGAFPLLKADTKTAETLQVTIADLPSHALGLVAGVNLYPLRRATFAFGVGGELLLADASEQNFDVDGTPLGPEVHTQLHSFSGQFSFNFGHRQGWSYITAGIGPLAFDTYLAETVPDRPRKLTVNAGFGARWFNTEHVAFSLDLRLYLAPPILQTGLVGGRDRQTLMVLSGGISLK